MLVELEAGKENVHSECPQFVHHQKTNVQVWVKTGHEVKKLVCVFLIPQSYCPLTKQAQDLVE